MAVDLDKVAKSEGIKYFLISFVDLFGVLRSKLVPARAIAQMQQDGAGFAGFAAWLDMTPADPDMFSIPDPDSLIQLPWRPEVAWLAGDLWMDDKPVEASPRIALKRQLEKAAAQDMYMKSGVECEYFLISPDGTAISDDRDIQEKPCYDQAALMRRYDVISEICDCMVELGWNPYQNDHEDANAHVSVWDKSGSTNKFSDASDEMGLSRLAYQFLGGIIHNADALAAVFNPTVNSYKRIDATVTLSGATWSPNAISYSGNNRTHMVRIPDPGRFELRLMDGAANPYLLQAGVLAAGLDGIANERDPGQRLDINMYTEGHKLRRIRRLPLNMKLSATSS
jgi:glutamine synthetase